MILRDYQEKLIHDVRESIRKGHKRILMQLWVGGGKTVISAEIMKLAYAKYKRSLFIAPRRQLVYQASETFTNYGINNALIMAGELQFNQPLVQVASIDTLVTRIKNGRMSYPDAAIVIQDEAHAAMSEERLKILGHYPLVIGITSTPALANGRGMGSFYTDIVEGPTMKEMVDNGFLVPMRYFGAESPDLANVKLNSDGDYQEKGLAEASDKPELIGAIYDNYKRIAGDRTTLIFAVNCKHAQHIHNEFLSHGVNSDYIDAHTDTDERAAIKRRVESGQTKVIVNIGVMAFGVDWPIISCVIIARVTRNISTWIQYLGRGTRLYPGKSECICIYHGDNFLELGMIDEPIEWNLEDKTTIKERKEKAAKEAKEPKEITCKQCGYIFKSRRDCPKCGCKMIPFGEAIPFHKADLIELTKPEKFSSEYKETFYRCLLGYARQHRYKEGWAYWQYKEKFGVGPAWKKEMREPSADVINWIKYQNIKKAKARMK
jgi:superfamily II DNA or RNA helicase